MLKKILVFLLLFTLIWKLSRERSLDFWNIWEWTGYVIFFSEDLSICEWFIIISLLIPHVWNLETQVTDHSSLCQSHHVDWWPSLEIINQNLGCDTHSENFSNIGCVWLLLRLMVYKTTTFNFEVLEMNFYGEEIKC